MEEHDHPTAGADQDVRYLSGLEYPAEKADVIATAERQDAPLEMIEALQAAPVECFNTPDEVRQAVHGA